MSTVYDKHSQVLQAIEDQLGRLHGALARGDGDTDVTQEQISQLQDELVRLSEVLCDAVIDNAKDS